VRWRCLRHATKDLVYSRRVTNIEGHCKTHDEKGVAVMALAACGAHSGDQLM